MLLSLQASGPQATVPTSGERFWWMVWGTKLPLWPLQQQRQTQHSRLQQLWDGWQVASHRRAQIFITADRYGGKNHKEKIFFHHDSEEFGWMHHCVVPPFLLLLRLCTSCACVFHFPPICFPQNSHMCIQGHWCSAAAHVFRLAVGLISAAYLGPGQIHTYTQRDAQTHRHVHALRRRQVVLAVCKDTWRKWSIREREMPVTASPLAAPRFSNAS